MDGEAEPTMRLHLHVSHAVQGELFPSADAQPVTRGYRGTVASKVAGITYRQLDYWARKQIVEPSITPSHGSGSRRLYSFKDVVILAVSKRLLDAGINLQNVRPPPSASSRSARPNSWPASPSCAMGRMCMSARTANRWWLCSKAAELCSGCPSDRYGIRSKRL